MAEYGIVRKLTVFPRYMVIHRDSDSTWGVMFDNLRKEDAEAVVQKLKES